MSVAKDNAHIRADFSAIIEEEVVVEGGIYVVEVVGYGADFDVKRRGGRALGLR
jgi:hypothetical protein